MEHSFEPSGDRTAERGFAVHLLSTEVLPLPGRDKLFLVKFGKTARDKQAATAESSGPSRRRAGHQSEIIRKHWALIDELR